MKNENVIKVELNNIKYKIILDETSEGSEFLRIENEKNNNNQIVHRIENKVLRDYDGFYSYDNLDEEFKKVIEKTDSLKIE
jgi:hypothetical protein